jgi:RimJ/RimL family protein N-acetyltransferase
VGVMTHELYQGRGYATLTCAHLLQACEALGYQTYWNCAKQNRASAALARKLGYRVEREYKLVAWFKVNGQSIQ